MQSTDATPTLTRREQQERRLAWYLALPALAVVFVTIVYPLAHSLVLSFMQHDLLRPGQGGFIGLANYMDAFSDPRFWNSLTVTAYFVVLAVALEIGGGLAWALLLNRSFRGRGWLRTVALIPWAIPPVVNGILWLWIYNPKYGALNGLLSDLGMISDYVNWLGEPFLALNMLVLADAWKETPFIMLLLLAGLQTIPGDLYDAARVDGANQWNILRHVILPLLRPMLFIALTLRTIWALKTFDLVYALTAGGPRYGTDLVTYFTYDTTFVSLQMGYGSAIAWIITLITLAVTVFYVRSMYGETVY